MKTKILFLAISLISMAISPVHAATGKVVACSGISTGPTNTGGKKTTSLQCLDGRSSVVLETIKGPAIINVWGSWCGPCRQELPHFRALAATGKVKIIGIDVEEKNMAAGRKFVIAQGITWPNIFDKDGRTKSAFGMGVPVTWFLNSKSVVVYRQIGIINTDKLLFDEVNKYLGIKV
jgi:cytochrome c biogenesis protein CcmG, thiol:disulfide interchange protein DsbE